jgi:hypothetical protein
LFPERVAFWRTGCLGIANSLLPGKIGGSKLALLSIELQAIGAVSKFEAIEKRDKRIEAVSDL